MFLAERVAGKGRVADDNYFFRPKVLIVADQAAVLGLGVAMLAVPDALPQLDNGTLVRLAPEWYADAGAISLYYASRELLPAKTRVFIDQLAEAFRREGLAQRFAGSIG